MNSSGKNIIYTLLKTASDHIYGYGSPNFPAEPPVFYDDLENCAIEEKNAQSGQFAAGSVESVSKKISECSRCALSSTRKNTVPGEGVLHPVVLVIGEGPGADEDATGRPFVGPAGRLLDKMLLSIALDRKKNCFIANIVKCRPPNNRDPKPEEAEACRAFLEAQITTLKPAMILAVGRIASQNLLRTETGIGRLRNTFHDLNGIPVLCTYHPSALLRNEDLKRPAWEDLKMFRTKLQSLVPGYENYMDTFFSPAAQH
ncbi:uracil-DNA glycosylase [Treponema parvum]|uniref:uracil-DNA glycosylase n=1 Tax=Treponema parvum TaxID=138851 RepID=UPI001AEC3913|nr:uracil-DNA glycosylase [Treponema parvum]QTQ16365.1 uracil-DNA glycosylase [Treponema parvum]